MPCRQKVRARMEALGPWLPGEQRWPLIQAAHRVFDPLWQSGLISRSKACWLLSKELNTPVWSAHFSKMHPAHLVQVAGAVENIRISIHERLRR